MTVWAALIPGAFLVGAAGGYFGAARVARRLTSKTRIRRA